MKHIGDVGEYIFFSVIWLLGIGIVLFLGYYLGTLHGSQPEEIISPLDALVSRLNTYVFAVPDYMTDYAEIINTSYKRILYVEIFLSILALVFLEVGGRKIYVLLPKLRLYKKEFYRQLKTGVDHHEK